MPNADKTTSVPILLSVIAFLVTLFGSIGTTALYKILDKIDRQGQQISDIQLVNATQGRDIYYVKARQNEQKTTWEDMLKPYAKKEEIFDLKRNIK